MDGVVWNLPSRVYGALRLLSFGKSYAVVVEFTISGLMQKVWI